MSDHYHVGYNVVGYLPDSEPHCFRRSTDAVDEFLDLLWQVADAWKAKCPNPGAGAPCAYCAAAGEARRAIVPAMDGNVAQGLLRHGEYADLITDPQGRVWWYWISREYGPPCGG